MPAGWEHKVEEGSMCYISPSGTALTSLERTCTYLLADGTCKCGLECPVNMHKVFNFDTGVVVAGRGLPGAQSQQDVTKLCNHRRKTAAMATLYHSMEDAPGPCHPGTVHFQDCLSLNALPLQKGAFPGIQCSALENHSETRPQEWHSISVFTFSVFSDK
ncbi:methyl-CpG-binding domain protein 6 isoform 2-T3 [Ciconia maguari]